MTALQGVGPSSKFLKSKQVKLAPTCNPPVLNSSPLSLIVGIKNSASVFGKERNALEHLAA